MVRKEKFGKFVLLEEIETSGLGSEFRAAKLSATGFEKLVTVLRLPPALSQDADAVKALMDQVKFAAQLHHSNLLKVQGIGKVDAAYYISYEFLEAKSLRAVFARARQDAFPFSVDHGLLIASKVCAALEHAHSRRVEAGVRYFHGFINPGSVVVSYEGEVRLRGFGTWPSRIREAGGATADEEAYLSPEQAAGGLGDTRSDTWAVGALLFEALTGRRYAEAGPSADAAARLSKARMKTPTSEEEAIPKAIAEILHKALAADPAARYGEVQELRKAVDTLLFSGDFSPTTFNLAFFMHSLFRQDIDREAEALQEEREASYLPYLAEEPARAAAPPPPPAPPAAPPPAAVEEPPVRKALTLADALVPPPPPPLPAAAASVAARHEPPAASPQQAAAGFTFHRAAPVAARSRAPLAIVGMAALLLVGAGAGYVSLRGRPPAAAAAALPTTTLSPEAVAAMARVKELEERLRAIEAEKAAAEAAAAEQARKKVEAQAAARGQVADAAVVARAEEGARRRAQAEQERRLREEQETLAREQRAAAENLANQRRREEEERAAAAAAVGVTTTTTTTTLPPPTPEPAPALRAGTLVNLSDAGVIAPVLDHAPVAAYPPIALRQKLEGTVELKVLVDERGSVIEAQVVTGAGGRSGLNEAAVESVKRRRYRPGIKDGVPVKVWIPVRVHFRLPS